MCVPRAYVYMQIFGYNFRYRVSMSVCMSAYTRSATAATTIGRTQCAHKLAFINNPKRLVSENDQEGKREREREKSPFPHTRSIPIYIIMYYV